MKKGILCLMFLIAASYTAAALDVAVMINGDAPLTASTLLSLNITGTGFIQYSLSCNNASFTAPYNSSGGFQSFNLSEHLSQGCSAINGKKITIYVKATDNLTYTYAKDDIYYSTSGPLAGLIQINDKNGFTNDITPLLNLSAIGADLMRFSCDGNLWTGYVTFSNNDSSFDITNGAFGCNASDGQHTIAVQFRDSITALDALPVNDSTFLDTTPPVMNNTAYSPGVVFDYDNVTLFSQATDPRLDTVWIEADFEGAMQTYFPKKKGLNYTYDIKAPLFIGQVISFRFLANDTLNNTASTPFITIVVIGTTISVYPPTPDCNSWYTVPPVISLTGIPLPNATIFYQWGFEYLPSIYSLPFNQTGLSGGIETISYWSANGTITEKRRKLILPIDVTPPRVQSTYPLKDSTVSSTSRISAVMDDVYFNNSLINLTSIIFKVDGIDRTAEANLSLVDKGRTIHINNQSIPVNYSATSDVWLNYTAAVPLGNSSHTAEIIFNDHACHSTSYQWTFTVNQGLSFNIQLNTPNLTIYNTKQLVVNASTTTLVSVIEYTHDSTQKIKLCKNCVQGVKKVTFPEGYTTLIVSATGNDNEIKSVNHTFFIDATPPKIIKTLPERRSVVKGLVEFNATIDENLNLSLVRILTSIPGLEQTDVPCTKADKYYECSIILDLSGFNGNFNYSFQAFDLINNVSSRNVLLTVDNIPPIVLLPLPDQELYGTKKVPTLVNISELSKLVFTVNGQPPRNACSKCNSYGRDLSFSDGFINLTFIAEDLAGNTGMNSTSFEVDSRAPKIIRTKPRKDTYQNASINFSMTYTEENLREAYLYYKNNLDPYIKINISALCNPGNNMQCSTLLDLPLEDGTLLYYFSINDRIQNDTSQPIPVIIDTTPPEITIISPLPITYIGPNIDLHVIVNEEVSKLEWSLDTDDAGAFQTFCTRCTERSRTLRGFTEGTHHIFIKATDYAGNTAATSVEFDVNLGND